MKIESGRGNQGLRRAGGEELMFSGYSFQLRNEEKFWRWTVTMAAQKYECT